MKKYYYRTVIPMLVALLIMLTTVAHARKEEPTIYVVKKGDTLWGLSERFIRDPYYWPDLWAGNSLQLTNPHIILPGQKLHIYPDRIEVVDKKETEHRLEKVPALPASETQSAAASPAVPPATPPVAKAPEEQVAPERTFLVNGGEGFIVENGFKPSGFVIAGQQNRRIFAEDDIIYTDIGRNFGGKVGDRYTIYKSYGSVSHPVTNQILGIRVAPLGTLQLTEMEENTSKALITSSFMEIEPGTYLLPEAKRKKEIVLKAADRDLTGYMVETRTGNQAIAAGDIAYVDLGSKQGLQVGNLLYVVRNAQTELGYFSGADYKLPVDLIGALVVVETGENTSTVLVVKSIDTIYKGDRFEMKKGR